MSGAIYLLLRSRRKRRKVPTMPPEYDAPMFTRRESRIVVVVLTLLALAVFVVWALAMGGALR